MELDELKSVWQEMDRKLGATMAMQQELRKDMRLEKTKRSVGRFLGVPISELILGLLTAGPAGAFLVNNFEHGTAAGSFAPVIILLLGALTVCLSVWQLGLIGGLDYSGPVLDIQRSLTKITQIRIKSAMGLLALLVPIWMVFPIFAMQLIAGHTGYLELAAKLADVYRSAWFAVNIIVGLALVGGAWLLVKWKGSRVNWTKVFSAASLVSASEYLAEIDRFAAEQ